MLDISFIREHKDRVSKAAADKGVDVDIDRLLELDQGRRALITEAEELRAKRNQSAAGNQKPTPEQIEEGKQLKQQLAEIEGNLNELDTEFNQLNRAVPNVMSEDTPIGPDDTGNEVISTWGDKKNFEFQPKEHWQLGESLGLIDKERAAKVSGARFTYMLGGLVELDLALTQYIVAKLTNPDEIKNIAEEFGVDASHEEFTPVYPPEIINVDVMQKMGRHEPTEDKYHIKEEDQLLVGSAEHSLGSMFMDEIIDVSQPKRYLGISSAFRREAGTYGKDTKGILRLHQFKKLEMESFTTAEAGQKEQDLFVAIQQQIMRDLNLPYQVVAICSGDMGKPDYRQIDIETWMPGQDKYRETHTSDYMTDFQSRRLKTRYKSDDGSKFVYMNDATATAGRTLIAIMENYQTVEGRIEVPEVLRPLMGGKAVI